MLIRLNDLVENVTPNQALGLGPKVDAAAIPPQVLQAVLANPALLNDPATTRTLLSLNAVVGIKATVTSRNPDYTHRHYLRIVSFHG